MSEEETYVPPTTFVRMAYALAAKDADTSRIEARREFNRWLAERDREVAARALREAADALRGERVRWGDYGGGFYGAHIIKIIDPKSKPYPTSQSTGLLDWLNLRADRIESEGA